MKVSARSTPTGRHSGEAGGGGKAGGGDQVYMYFDHPWTLSPTPIIVWLGFGAPSGSRRERTEDNKEEQEGRRSRSRSMRRLRRPTRHNRNDDPAVSSQSGYDMT